jgi:uncharacterized protein
MKPFPQTKAMIATPTLGRVWVVLAAGPALIFLGIVTASIYFGVATQGDVAAIPGLVAASTPYQLVAIQILLFFILRWAMQGDQLAWNDIGWKTAEGQQPWREVLIGIVPGAVLGVVYVRVLSPWLTNVQQSLGDYVAAGELLPMLGAAMLPFFIANVVLAPFVEENIYRGYALTRLFGRFSTPVAILLVLFLRPAALGRRYLVHPADRNPGRWLVRRALHGTKEYDRTLCGAPGAEYRGISFHLAGVIMAFSSCVGSYFAPPGEIRTYTRRNP